MKLALLTLRRPYRPTFYIVKVVSSLYVWPRVPVPPYMLIDEHGQVLSGITERDLIWYRQRQKEQK